PFATLSWPLQGPAGPWNSARSRPCLTKNLIYDAGRFRGRVARSRYDPTPWSAPVAELVDAPDSKSGGFTSVLVRVRPGAPSQTRQEKGPLAGPFRVWRSCGAPTERGYSMLAPTTSAHLPVMISLA